MTARKTNHRRGGFTRGLRQKKKKSKRLNILVGISLFVYVMFVMINVMFVSHVLTLIDV